MSWQLYRRCHRDDRSDERGRSQYEKNLPVVFSACQTDISRPVIQDYGEDADTDLGQENGGNHH